MPEMRIGMKSTVQRIKKEEFKETLRQPIFFSILQKVE